MYVHVFFLSLSGSSVLINIEHNVFMYLHVNKLLIISTTFITVIIFSMYRVIGDIVVVFFPILHAFPHAWRQQHVFPTSSNWFIGLS